MSKEILGIHHVTAIASDPQKNLNFYAGFLGLRLVKVTVNFDDPETYHFYYGDELGRPGSIMTFFVWSDAPKGRQGTGQATIVSFAMPYLQQDQLGQRLKAVAERRDELKAAARFERDSKKSKRE